MATHADKLMLEAAGGGSIAESAGGIGAVVMSILALAGIWPAVLAAITTIVIGAALMLKGGPIMAEYRRGLAHLDNDNLTQAEIGGGLSAEMLAGGAGVVLGILALLGLVPEVLTASAVLVFGAALLLSSGSTAKLAAMRVGSSASEGTGQMLAREAAQTASGAQVLLGIGAGVLGILSLVGIHPIYLTVVGLLAIGATSVLAGTALGGRLLSLLEH